MNILTAAEMREVDRLTIEAGIPGLILMENAGSRVVDFMRETFAPLSDHRVVVVCGKGNNGGDGFVVARQLFTRNLCASLQVIELFDKSALTGDALANRIMLEVSGCPTARELPTQSQAATLIVDAVLGTGLTGPAKGEALDAIKAINAYYPLAKKIAVDIPSGLPSDDPKLEGEFVKADFTVTFTAAKRTQCLSPSYEHCGQLTVYPIGTPPAFYHSKPIHLTTPADLRQLFAKRRKDSNKGLYGHVYVVGGSFGKAGAPSMAALGSFRSGAGLVSVAVPKEILPTVAAYHPELMTESLETSDLQRATVLAVGPGFGTSPDAVRFVTRLYTESSLPAVFDADALNILAADLPKTDKIRILTPHPGEMGRLVGISTKEVQADRLDHAQALARKSGATVVLKGDRTIIAFPDGEAWVNPTGSPSMATGGTGDILTGMVAGMVAQHPSDWRMAVCAAVWLHGRCGELAARDLGEESTLATDLLTYLPEAMNELRP